MSLFSALFNSVHWELSFVSLAVQYIPFLPRISTMVVSLSPCNLCQFEVIYSFRVHTITTVLTTRREQQLMSRRTFAYNSCHIPGFASCNIRVCTYTTWSMRPVVFSAMWVMNSDVYQLSWGSHLTIRLMSSETVQLTTNSNWETENRSRLYWTGLLWRGLQMKMDNYVVEGMYERD